MSKQAPVTAFERKIEASAMPKLCHELIRLLTSCLPQRHSRWYFELGYLNGKHQLNNLRQHDQAALDLYKQTTAKSGC